MECHNLHLKNGMSFSEFRDKIRKKQQSLDELKQVDSESMKKVDEKARAETEKQINSYYQSTKFFKASLTSGRDCWFKNGFKGDIRTYTC